MAGHYVIPEVTLYFGHRLFRGNRTAKVSSDRLNAFDSPNLSPLATLGINIESKLYYFVQKLPFYKLLEQILIFCFLCLSS